MRLEKRQHRYRRRVASWTTVALILAGASGCAATSSYREIRPACKAPAPLEGKFDPAVPGFFIELRPAPDLMQVVNDLVIRYSGFHPRGTYDYRAMLMAGEMTPETVAALRCDTAVKSVSHDKPLKHLF